MSNAPDKTAHTILGRERTFAEQFALYNEDTSPKVLLKHAQFAEKKANERLEETAALKAELERVKADAEYWQKHHDALQRAMNAARQRENALQAEKGELLAALKRIHELLAHARCIYLQ